MSKKSFWCRIGLHDYLYKIYSGTGRNCIMQSIPCVIEEWECRKCNKIKKRVMESY